LRHFIAITLLSSLAFAADPHAVPSAPMAAVSSDKALQLLVEGNQRFVAGESNYPRSGMERRCETFGGGQHPVATILSCADSRVPPEYIFDAGIGDLFVIRVAGNVSDTDEIATIEYGAGHLGTPLIVVMGHSKCGAVTAVVDGAPLHGNLALLVDNIQPAAEKIKTKFPQLTGAPLVAKAIRANVFQSMQDLIENSDDVRALIKDKKVTLVGALYDLHSGSVEMLGAHPRESELLSAPPKPKVKDAHAEQIKGGHDAAPARASPKKPAEQADTQHEGHSAAPAHEGETHADADLKQEPSPVKKYGPVAAFSVGSLALSALVIHLLRR